MLNQRICLFIPTFNVETTVVDVLEGISKDCLARIQRIYLIDNRSSDRTVEVLKSYLASRGDERFKLYQNAENYQLGGSNIIALRLAKSENMDYLICLHSDGQADPKDLPQILDLLDGQRDFVFGSRFLPSSRVGDYSLMRRWGNLFFVFLQQQLLGQKVYDIGSFLAMRVKSVTDLPYGRYPADMGYQPILVMAAFRFGSINFAEIPIGWGKVKNSSVKPLGYALRHLSRLVQIYLGHIPLTDKTPDDFLTQEIQVSSAL